MGPQAAPNPRAPRFSLRARPPLGDAVPDVGAAATGGTPSPTLSAAARTLSATPGGRRVRVGRAKPLPNRRPPSRGRSATLCPQSPAASQSAHHRGVRRNVYPATTGRARFPRSARTWGPPPHVTAGGCAHRRAPTRTARFSVRTESAASISEIEGNPLQGSTGAPGMCSEHVHLARFRGIIGHRFAPGALPERAKSQSRLSCLSPRVVCVLFPVRTRDHRGRARGVR